MQTIPNSTITLMGTAATLCFILPILLLVAYKKNTRAPIRPCIYGIVIFLAFAQALEQTAHFLLLGLNTPISRFLQSSAWIYAIYGGLMAGIFEETGRFVAFRLLDKENTNQTTPIMYGIGHGGTETILVGAFGLFNSMIMAASINAMGVDSLLQNAGDAAPTLEAAIDSILTTPSNMYFISVWERVSALILQISLSVLVYTAVKTPKARYLFPLSIVLHILVDFFAALYQTGVITNLYLLEGVIFIYSLGVGFFAWNIYQASQKQ